MAFAMRLAVMPLIVAALAGVQQSHAKVLAGTIQLDGEFPEHYISKFSINQEGLIKGKLSTETGEAFTTGGLSMFLYNAEDWPEYAKQVTCMDRARLAKYRFQIGRDGGGDISAEQERQASYQLNTFDGHFEFTRELHLEDGEVWYIVIADCSLEQIYHEMPPIVFDVELMNGDSQLPAEEFGLAYVYTILVVILILAGVYGFGLVQEQRANNGTLHLIVKLLLLAYALNLVGTSFECVHLWIYAGNGKGSWFLNKLGELIMASFCVAVNFVLLCLACGWTLTEESTTASFMTAFKDPSKLLQWVTVGGMQVPAIVGAPSSLVVILFAGSFMVVEMVDVMTSNKDDDFSKFHAHDSNAGMTLMALQVVFCILFVYSITNTIKVVPPRLKTFCQSLTVAGVLWFLTTPTFVVLAPMFSKVWRHRFVTSGSIVMQTASLLTMCRLFLTSSTEYYKLSTMANMGTMLGLSNGPAVRGSGKSID